jgi:tRNA (guanine-N7-)-methyltransferase
MRLRKVKNAAEIISQHPEYMISDPETMRGRWHEVFGRHRPIRLEIGIGKGRFLFETARRHPDVDFIGIERFDSVIVRALEKLLAEPLRNVRLILMDADRLPETFAPGEINQLYLNFSDPWPKNHHVKRRLTHPLFLARYRAILEKNAPILFKTDNFALFSYTMMTLVEQGEAIERISTDLHAEADTDNVETEFETRFVSLGQPIYYIAFHIQEDTDRVEAALSRTR